MVSFFKIQDGKTKICKLKKPTLNESLKGVSHKIIDKNKTVTKNNLSWF